VPDLHIARNTICWPLNSTSHRADGRASASTRKSGTGTRLFRHMITAEKYQSASKVAERGFLWRLGTFCAVGIAYFVALFACVKPFWNQFLDDWVPAIGVGWSVVVLILPTIPGVLFFWWGARLGSRRLSNDAQLQCEHCGKHLRGPVVETGNCGCCGRRVLSNPTQPELSPHGNSSSDDCSRPIAEFVQGVEVGHRRIARTLLWMSVYSIAAFVLFLAFCRKGKSLDLDLIYESRGSIAAILLGVLILTVIVGPVGWLIARAEFKNRSDQRTKCHHCAKYMGVQPAVVVATRNCIHCGRRVLREPEALSQSRSNPPVAEAITESVPLKTLEEFSAATKAFTQLMTKRLVWILLLLLVYLGVLAMIGPPIRETAVANWGRERAGAVMPLLMTPMVFIVLGFGIESGRTLGRIPAANCPYCNRFIADQRRFYVIATRRCPYCGQRILNTP